MFAFFFLFFFLKMPYFKSDSYVAQISLNIFKLANTSPITFEIKSIFDLFAQPALLRFFEQHQNLGLDIAPFVFAMLVHMAVMLDGVELFNPDGTGFLTSINLFLHLIGEPGELLLVYLLTLLIFILFSRY